MPCAVCKSSNTHKMGCRPREQFDGYFFGDLDTTEFLTAVTAVIRIDRDVKATENIRAGINARLIRELNMRYGIDNIVDESIEFENFGDFHHPDKWAFIARADLKPYPSAE